MDFCLAFRAKIFKDYGRHAIFTRNLAVFQFEHINDLLCRSRTLTNGELITHVIHADKGKIGSNSIETHNI